MSKKIVASVYISDNKPSGSQAAPAASPPPSKIAKKMAVGDASVFIGPSGSPPPATGSQPRVTFSKASPTINIIGSVFIGGPAPPASASAAATKSVGAKSTASGSKTASSSSTVSFKSASPSSSSSDAPPKGSSSIIGGTAVSTLKIKSVLGQSGAQSTGGVGGDQLQSAVGGPSSSAASSSISKSAASKSTIGGVCADQLQSVISSPSGASSSRIGIKSTATGSTSSAASKSVGSKSMGSKSKGKSTEGPVDPAVIAKIEDGYAILQRATDCKSLLKKHLTKEVLDTLKTKNTSFGSTLWDVIQSGVKNLDSGVGVYAPDAEAYRTFIDLFDPILAEYHGFTREQKQPPVDLGEGKIHEFVDLDPENKFIVSTRIRCGRSIQGYPFNPCLTEENYKEMEQKMISLFGGIKDPDLQGTYYPLTGMTKEVQNELIKDHFLFKEGDRFLREANACRFWPAGRGIFLNQKKTFLVWVNEEDHLRIISMQPGGHAGQVLDRLIKGLKTIEAQMPFSRDERFGWLTFCPTNLGTTIRASVHIKVPKISKQPDFKTICDSMKLQIRGIHGEHSETEGGVYDISNKVRLGFSEYAVIKQMYDGVKKLIEMEKAAS